MKFLKSKLGLSMQFELDMNTPKVLNTVMTTHAANGDMSLC